MNELDTTEPPLGVAIVEDDWAVREGLSLLIDGTAGYRCVGRGTRSKRRSASAAARYGLIESVTHGPGLKCYPWSRSHKVRGTYPSARFRDDGFDEYLPVGTSAAS